MEHIQEDKGLRSQAVMALVCGVTAISTGAILVKLADAPALVIAAYRVGLAALILVPVAAWQARSELRSLTRSDVKIAALAGLFLALHFAFWVSSLQFTSIANSVVLVNTSPLWVGIFSPLIIREKIHRRVVLSILLSIFGAFIIGYGDYSLGGDELRGDVLALAGGLCMAGYLLMGRKLRRKLSLIAYISLCYGSAAMILWITVILFGFPVWGFGGQTIAAFFCMAIFPQLIGHSCYNWALKYFSASFIAVSLLGEPVGSTFLAYLIFNEGLTFLKVIGGVFILTAIVLAASQENS